MSELDELLSELREHPGVRHALLLGRDGLLIRHLGDGAAIERDTVAAMVPGVGAACSELGRAADRGDFSTAVVEYAAGVAIVVAVSPELLLALVLEPGVGFAPLLHRVRGERDRLAAAL